MVRATATVALIGVVAAAGCGCGGSNSPHRDAALTAGEVANRLAAWVSDNSRRSTLTGVECFKRSAREFGCVGDFQASRAYAKAATGSIDTSDFDAHDWKLLQERHNGRETYDVTVDRADGSLVVNPIGGR